MTREIALHCMKSYSELHSDLCELCSIYGETGSDHCFEDALQYVIGMLEQEPKTGHWIKGYTFPDGAYWKCDKCNELIKVKIPMRYCNNCGAKMVEPQESEET